eukprot:1167094-Pyramimonas_sp.AAC.1
MHIDVLEVLEKCWPLGGFLGRLCGRLEPSWGGLAASWSTLETILRHLGGHRRLYEARLEPSRAILDAILGGDAT